MPLIILSIAVILLFPVAIGWRIAFIMLKNNPTPPVKMFFWVMSGLFILLAAVAFVATRYL